MDTNRVHCGRTATVQAKPAPGAQLPGPWRQLGLAWLRCNQCRYVSSVAQLAKTQVSYLVPFHLEVTVSPVLPPRLLDPVDVYLQVPRVFRSPQILEKVRNPNSVDVVEAESPKTRAR